MTLSSDGKLHFYLDGARRHDDKPLGRNSLDLPSGRLLLGYYKNTNGTEHYYKGSISNVDIIEQVYGHSLVLNYIVEDCIPDSAGLWGNKAWDGFHLAKLLDSCDSRGKFFSFLIKNKHLSNFMSQTTSGFKCSAQSLQKFQKPFDT